MTIDELIREKPLTRTEQKRNSILEAAREAFLDKGFESVSMDTIAENAAVSKRTVYSHFGSKEELFGGIMQDACDSKHDVLLSTIDIDRPIKDVLTDIGLNFLFAMFDGETIALVRILIGNIEQLPGLGETFLEGGPREAIGALANYLHSQQDKGIIKVTDPVEAAGSFMSSLFGFRQMQALVTNIPPPDATEINAMVEGAVIRFLYGVTVR